MGYLTIAHLEIQEVASQVAIEVLCQAFKSLQAINLGLLWFHPGRVVSSCFNSGLSTKRATASAALELSLMKGNLFWVHHLWTAHFLKKVASYNHIVKRLSVVSLISRASSGFEEKLDASQFIKTMRMLVPHGVLVSVWLLWMVLFCLWPSSHSTNSCKGMWGNYQW